MKTADRPFLGLEPRLATFETAAVVILPVPYEGGVSYGQGAARGPEAIIEASEQVELYDEDLRLETCRAGICTLAAHDFGATAGEMVDSVRESVFEIVRAGKIPCVIGGDHSVTVGAFTAVLDHFGDVGTVQIDAHADLRQEYEGSELSHACVMARIRERTHHTLQLGIRALSAEEGTLVERGGLALATMREVRDSSFDLSAALERLPERVYLTVDVDALDGSVIRSTGTPEPGGFTWYETLDLLQRIFSKKHVVGFDLVELSGNGDAFSSFSAARLVYKMIGFAVSSQT